MNPHPTLKAAISAVSRLSVPVTPITGGMINSKAPAAMTMLRAIARPRGSIVAAASAAV